MCVGAIVRIAPGHVVQSMIAFKSTILLNVLLPPIILNSGYQLKQVSSRFIFGKVTQLMFPSLSLSPSSRRRTFSETLESFSPSPLREPSFRQSHSGQSSQNSRRRL